MGTARLARSSSDEVGHFYDAATRAFLLGGRGQRAIHRELWGPGVTDARAALQHVHELVAEELGQVLRERAGRGQVLDLGCGVGAATVRLAQEHQVDVTGVTVSRKQVQLARRFAAQTGPLRGTVRFVEADFTDLPGDLVGFDLAFAIESFVHAGRAELFFRDAARALRVGGRLVLVDDFVSAGPTGPALAAENALLDDVRTGWHAPSLLSVAQVTDLAAAAGLVLVGSTDLSGQQRLGRPRDRLVAVAQPALRRLRSRSQWAGAMVGGHALQRAYRAGQLEYRLLRFTRWGTADRPVEHCGASG